jgi:hypothetical protein
VIATCRSAERASFGLTRGDDMNLPAASIRLTVGVPAATALTGAPAGHWMTARSLSSTTAAQAGHWFRYPVDNKGRTIDAYMVRDSQPKPVVILLQGSGCAPLMTVECERRVQ